MTSTDEAHEVRTTAMELLRFLDEMMRTIVPVDLGAAGIAQLTLVERQILVALRGTDRPMHLGEIASVAGASLGQAGQGADRLRGRGLVERAGGGRGAERAFVINRRGRQLLGSLDASHQAALEGFISQLAPPQRLRLESAAHLLGAQLDRLAKGMLAA